ncbi:hypothetical protein [Maritimibacter sp. UBA3975]|uniref:hypothetical protein n=1 Tax=Maritimibacter sp. UBA3975 TaxID=1946833 RepID=UPI000C09F154|nr:hypothetical protein [Maritimibacter sp. UBA3975]MAM60433.1 hypothetical protein [Maritimibacter sp.]|tara:strand:+ start:14414 stop:14650 length:237 start_codon:yes stop_codon:yes gene_type:complete
MFFLADIAQRVLHVFVIARGHWGFAAGEIVFVASVSRLRFSLVADATIIWERFENAVTEGRALRLVARPSLHANGSKK